MTTTYLVDGKPMTEAEFAQKKFHTLIISILNYHDIAL